MTITEPAQRRSGSRTALAADFRVAVARLSRRLRAQKVDPIVSDAQFSALARLHREGAMTLAELSRHEGVTPPSMNRTVNTLVERGLVSKDGHDDDRRKVQLAVTDAGSAVVVATRRARDAWLAPRLAALTPAERTTLAEATEIMRRLEQQ